MTERPRISPVLVGRDDLLDLAARRAAAVRAGSGHLLFLAGEAGIGKTRLLGAILRQAQRTEFRPVAAAAYPRDLEIPGAMLLDLGDALRRSGDDAWREQGRTLLQRLGTVDAAIGGDLHRQRRLLVLEVADRIAAIAERGPVVVALEDLHWADDLTLEVIGLLARRLRDTPMLMIGTYRSDELYPRVPMREWRARLLTQRLAEEARLSRLSLEQTGSVATLLLGGDLPASRQLAELVHRRSDGIPLHVEELLATLSVDAATRGLETPALPETLSEAVLQRASALSPSARRVAASAAVIGRSFDLDFITAVHGGSATGVGRALAELVRRFFVVEAADGWHDFRHALIRDALEAGIDPARRRLLHGRVAAAAAERPEIGSDAFLSAHYELAGDPARAFHHARLAAARASAFSSHREALDLVRRALRAAPADLPARERAALLRSEAMEEAATDDNAAAAASLTEARRILLAAGDRIAAAELLPPLVAARHLLGDGLEQRVAMLESEIGPDRGGAAELPDATRGRLLAALSAAHMLDRRLDDAIEHGTSALEIATAGEDMTTRLHVEATLGSCLVFAGRMEEGWRMLEAAVQRARQARREAEAARAYRMIGSCASVLVEYELGERWLRDGIEYAERTEQWNHRHYMAAHLAHVAWARGDWEAADELGDRAMADGRGGVTTTITALHVRGYLALGRGSFDVAVTALAEARRLGEEMQELQRLSPALWGLAESALLEDRVEEAIELTDAGLAASRAVSDAAYLFPFLVTGVRARLAAGDVAAAGRWADEVGRALHARSIPGTLPAIDHARGLLELAAGRTGKARRSLAAAHQGWEARGRWWEGTWAGLDLSRCLFRANRLADAASLVERVEARASRVHAAPVLTAAAELSTRLRARHPRADAWAPLSAREFEVARLIAAGRTNREIAVELAIAPKTVAAHVEHILARLGVSRRAEIAAWVGRMPFDATTAARS